MYLITVYGITGHQIFERTIAADDFLRLANKMIHTTQEYQIGDNVELMREMHADSIDTIITSPPYYGLRDYGVDGQIGLEGTLEEYHARLLEVTAECMRVLKPTGVMFWNHGDSYGGSGGYGGDYAEGGLREGQPKVGRFVGTTPKCLAMQNERLIIKMIDQQGWILRNRIVWHKSNGMPSSVTDRFSNKYEPVYMLVKQRSYWFDLDAVRIPAKYPEVWSRKGAGKDTPYAQNNPRARYGLTKHEMATQRTSGSYSDPLHQKPVHPSGMKNPGDVWTIPTQPYPESHFACVDTDTECLTLSGWKRYDEIVVGELLASFDMEMQVLRYEPLIDVAVYDYDGAMVKVKTLSTDMLLTPNHRCVTRRQNRRKSELSKYRFVIAEDLTTREHMPTFEKWEEGTFGMLPSPSREYAEILGWIISEAHLSEKQRSVHINQSLSANPDKCKRIEYILNTLGIKYRMRVQTKKYFRIKDGKQTDDWYINEMAVYTLNWLGTRKILGIIPDKTFTSQMMLWTEDAINGLFDGFVGGDGHVRPDGRISVTQKSKKTVDLFQAMCFRLGKRSISTMRKDGQYNISITNKKYIGTRSTNGSSSLGTEYYHGKVWCPSLPSGTWVARRNGKIFITGNTFPPALIDPMIKAACPAEICPVCGLARERIAEKEVEFTSGSGKAGNIPKGKHEGSVQAESGTYDIRMGPQVTHRTIGWTSCSCGAAWIAGTVLDPFCGSGTVLEVCRLLNRNAIGLELNPEYEPLIRERSMSHTPPLTAYTEANI